MEIKRTELDLSPSSRKPFIMRHQAYTDTVEDF